MFSSGATAAACRVLIMALEVAWARVFLGVHFPLDMVDAVVVAGISLVHPWSKIAGLHTFTNDTL